MYFVGDFIAGSTVKVMWNTNAGDGSSITRATDGTLKIFKGTNIAERTSLAGVTQSEDFDGATGVHAVSIDLTDNTDAGFYAAGNDYFLVYTGMTIDGKTVNNAIAQFSIENRTQYADVKKWRGTAVADPTTEGKVVIDATPLDVATLAADLITNGIASIAKQNAVPNGAIVAASFGASAIDAAAIAADAGTEIGTAVWATTTRQLTGTQTFNLTGNITGNLSGSVGSVTGSAGTWNSSWDAEVQSEVQDAIVANRLHELLAADSDIDGAAPPAVGSVFFELMSSTPSSFTFTQTSDSLSALSDVVADVKQTGLETASDVTTVISTVTTIQVTTNDIFGKTQFLPSATAGTSGGLFIAGTNAATVITGSLTTTFTGNLTGSVGSVATGGITAASIADNAIDTATFAAGTTLPRVTLVDTVTELTEVISGGGLDAAGVRAAIGMATANLDTQLGGISAKTNSLTFTVAGHVDSNVLKVGGQNATATGAVDFDEIGSGGGGAANIHVTQRGVHVNQN